MATLYTIGHSNISVPEFIELLKPHGIEVVIDVRSDPYSRYAVQFNKHDIEIELFYHGFEYIYWGDRLGGRPKSPGFYTITGDPDYEKMAAVPAFQAAIEELELLATARCVALMCSEADPMACHRERLLAWVLRNRGNEVLHILSDGSIAKQEQESLL
jgi:uncharacterized protein (DUF488 family)